MRWIAFVCLVLILTGSFAAPVVCAQPLPDYEKILQIHLNYQDSRYSVSALEVRYGKAPNLNIRTGNLKGTILDAQEKELKSFSFQEPGIAYGDSSGPANGGSLIGYVQESSSGDMVITLPYLPGIQKLSVSDSRDGTLLVLVDLNPVITTFCTNYPDDPDCLMRIPPIKSGVPDSGMNLELAGIFFVSVIIAGGMAILTIRRRTREETPEKRVVLIVDDNPDIVRLIHLSLEKAGYATIMATGGKECLEILRTKIPDVILLDILMEPMDGWETLEQIRKRPESKSVPVLMLTGKRLTMAEAKQYRICIDDYIMKPFQMNDLYTAIDAILVRKEKLKESLVLARQAGVDKEKFCEFAKLSRRITAEKKIMDILQGSHEVHGWDDGTDPRDAAVIREIHRVTRIKENRFEQLREEINSAFRSKGLPELSM